MRFGTAALALWIVAGHAMALPNEELDIRMVQELNRLETYDGHVVHAGFLWTSEGRIHDGDAYRVHVFAAASGDKVGTLSLPHSAHYLYAFGDGRVIAVGKTASPSWQTYYSALEARSGRTRVVSTQAFPTRYQVYQFAGSPEDRFFNEPGSRGIYRERSGRLTKVGGDVSMPAMMRWDDQAGKLWIVESGSLGFGDENLVVMDPAAGTTRRVFSQSRPGLTDIELFADLGWVVANETLTDSLLFIRTDNQKLKTTAEVPAGPRGLARFGVCVAVSSPLAMAVTFFALDADTPEHVATWDISAAGDRLKNPRGIAIDGETGTVYLRSAYPCPSCTTTQSSIYRVSDQGAIADRCL